MNARARNTPDAGPWQARFPLYYGWVIVAIAFATNFVASAIQLWALSIFVVPMQEELDWTRSAIFLPLTVRSIIAAIGTPFFGRYLDRRHGAMALLAYSGVMMGISTALVASVQSEWQFMLFFGVVGGIGSFGQSFVISAAIVPKWFIRQRGRAMALATMGTGAAAFATPLTTTVLINLFGWRSAWALLGLAMVLITVPLALLIRRQPEDVGMQPDGVKPSSGISGTQPTHPYEQSFTPSEAFRTRSLWLLVLALLLASLSIVGLPASMVPMFIDLGFSPQVAAGGLTTYGLFSVIARFGWGYLAERTHVRIALMTLCAYATVVSLLLRFALGDVVTLFLFSAMTGFAIGGVVVLNPLVWPTYFGRAHVGAINGFVFPLTSIAGAGGPLMMALIYDRTGNYDLGLSILIGSWAMSAVVMFYAKPIPRATQAPAPDGD